MLAAVLATIEEEIYKLPMIIMSLQMLINDIKIQSRANSHSRNSTKRWKTIFVMSLKRYHRPSLMKMKLVLKARRQLSKRAAIMTKKITYLLKITKQLTKI